MTLISLVPEENSTSCQAELRNINQWATDNNLRINPDKTLEIRGRRGIQAEAQPPLTIQNRERANGVKAL